MRAKYENLLNITHLYQWPLRRGSTGNFSIAVPSEIYNDQASYIGNLGTGCDDGKCMWISGANLPSHCAVSLYAGDWRDGGTPIRTLTDVSCQSSSLVTLRIPDDIYYAYPSLNVVVSNRDAPVWTDPRYLQLR
jgi:hypothetical protein